MASRSVNTGSATSSSQRIFSSIGNDGKVPLPEFGGKLRWNDYSLVDIRINRSAGSSPLYNGDVWFSAGIIVSQIGNNEILEIQSRLLSEVRGHDFNLGTSLAEGKQTVSMVTSAIGAVGGAIHDLKRGRFESAARRFGVAPRPSHLNKKDVAGRWLELQYGWLPLLNDVYESSKAYEVLTSGPRITRIYANLTKNGIIDVSESPALYSCKGNMKSRMRIIYEASEVMSASRSLGLTNPASVAWELIPYSFIADWFIPIGTYLENLNQIPSLNGRFLTNINERAVCSSSVKPFSETGVSWTSQPVVSQTLFSMSRDASTSLDVPTPRFVSIAEAMSPKRIWNSLALLTQRL